MSLEDMMERGPIPVQVVANRVCNQLPGGYELRVVMGYGGAWLELIDGDCNDVALPDAADKSLDEQINDAVCVACGLKEVSELAD